MNSLWELGPAWLFCPADRPDRYRKALAIADVVIFDLEDAVAPAKKNEARSALRALVAENAFDAGRTVVRVNAPASGVDHVRDLEVVNDLSLPRVMLAKSERVSDIAEIPCDVLVLVESAIGVERVHTLSEAQNVVAMMWGAEDFVASMGGTSSRLSGGQYRDVARFARSRVLTAAKAAGVLALDAVHLNIADAAGLRSECEDAVASGFDGTVAIHPSQVPVIRGAYAPTAAQLEWASRVVARFVDCREGVGTLDGQMIDGPVYRQAQRTLRLAELVRERTTGRP